MFHGRSTRFQRTGPLTAAPLFVVQTGNPTSRNSGRESMRIPYHFDKGQGLGLQKLDSAAHADSKGPCLSGHEIVRPIIKSRPAQTVDLSPAPTPQ